MMKKIILLLLILLVGCTANYEEYYILELKGNEVTLAPSDYDGDAKEMFEDKIIIRKLADKVTYKEVFEHTIIKNEKKKTKITKNNITIKEIKEAVKYDCAHVRVTFNKNNEIDSMTLWGDLVIYE